MSANTKKFIEEPRFEQDKTGRTIPVTRVHTLYFNKEEVRLMKQNKEKKQVVA